MESLHILTSLFRANENECRVSRGKNRERGGSKETRTLKGGGRWRGESEIRQNQVQTKKGQGKEGEGSEGVRRIER